MAKGRNVVELLGNVGKDPEVRSTATGFTVANFSLATAERKKEGDNWVDHTEWHSLVALGRTAEIVRDYVKKGSQLFIEGKLQTRSWEDRSSGEKKYRTEIVINELYLLGGNGGERRESSQGSYGQRQNGSRPAATQNRSHEEDYADQGITDEDIPF